MIGGRAPTDKERATDCGMKKGADGNDCISQCEAEEGMEDERLDETESTAVIYLETDKKDALVLTK